MNSNNAMIEAGATGILSTQGITGCGSEQARSIDDAPLNRFHMRMTALTFGAHFTAGYVMGSIALALAGLSSTVDVSPMWQGLLGSSALIGVFLGSILTGLVADRFGRQKIFLFSFVAIAVTTALQYFATGPVSLFVLRILVGLAIGADYSVGATLLTEFLPRESRGALLGTLVAVWTVGYVAASVVGVYIVAPNDWNVLLASAAIPAIVVLFLRVGTPESPRWLVRMGRKEEAQAIVDKYIGPGYAVYDNPVIDAGVKTLFSKRYLKTLVFICCFWSFNVIPYFAVYTFLPIILQSFGLVETSLIDILLNFVLLGGAILGIFLIAKCTRRGFCIWSNAICAICLGMLALLPSGSTTAQVFAFAVFTVMIAALGDMTSVYPAEVFPTEVRSIGIGLATGVSRLASAVGTFLLPVLMSSFGLGVTLGTLAAICALSMVLCIVLAPETKGLSLSEASAGSSRA